MNPCARILPLAALAFASSAIAAPALQTRLPDLPISIRYPQGRERAAQEIARAAGASAAEMARSFGLDSVPPLLLDLVRDGREFGAATGGRAPDWGAAMAFPSQGRAVFDLSAVADHPHGAEAVVRHELAHLLFGAASGGMTAPAWFQEGLAMVEAREWDLRDSWELLEASLRGSLPTLADLDASFPEWGTEANVAYRLSLRAVSGILRKAPPGALADLAARSREADTFEQAFEGAFGYALESYAARFSRETSRTYRNAVLFTSVPALLAGMSVLFLLASGAKWLRARRTLRRWAEEDMEKPAPIVPFPELRVGPRTGSDDEPKGD
jgi:hypothetical protein